MIEPFSLPLASPLDTAAGAITERQGFLLRTRDGLGEATPLSGWTESREKCRDALETADAALPDWQAALDACRGRPAARHAVALAHLDAASRAEREPLYRFLADDDSWVESVPVNATVGDDSVESTVASAREAVASGFDCVKVKVGARAVADDVERLRAVRAAVGADVELRADANAAWSADEANYAFDELAGDVSYVEQPLAKSDLDGHAALREHDVGVALDETLTEYGVREVLAADAADAVVLKPMALGGLDRAREVALTAREAGVAAVVTTTVDAVVARTAAVHLAASLPGAPACGLATASLLDADLAPDPAPVGDGEVSVPQDPGNLPGEVRP
ncbi:mandelate racemase/muconate lactonizing enzyme family protein [Salarchaeum sp. JOR-1]|uniref:mandelate racemase/muconate lactonizing enzyme family protein n=1 Tax=Salarchaeum sp. JOR-1 TaxID=2599399 RepID=UPI0011985018|nr:enolase C-terminal domain-like protein [Salarchaeum sp. JOR-1]QDX41237.1 o-succinylbenzoate synthase [Salarchaeum sp. JOR-1]